MRYLIVRDAQGMQAAVAEQRTLSRWLRRIPWIGSRLYTIAGSKGEGLYGQRTYFLEVRWRTRQGRVLLSWESVSER